MLRRNGILPIGQGGGSSGAGGSTDGSGSGGRAWTDLKAVLELGKRDTVRRLAKQVRVFREALRCMAAAYRHGSYVISATKS